MSCLFYLSTFLLLFRQGAYGHGGDHGHVNNDGEEAAHHHQHLRIGHIIPPDAVVHEEAHNNDEGRYTEHILMNHDHVMHEQIDHHAHDQIHAHDHDHHDHDHADVFESCIITCHRDLAAKYGVEYADQLQADGFVFAECPDDDHEDDVPTTNANGNSDADDGNNNNNNNIQHATTSDANLQWNIPQFRRPDGKLEIPYEIMSTSFFNQETRDTIQRALSAIESESGVLTFVPRTTQSSYIYFKYTLSGCAAHVGRYSPTSVYLGWCRYSQHFGAIVHEVLHALGFWHEQSRPDRDEHVQIVQANVQPGYFSSNFAKMTAVDSLGSPYDYSSIMHYPSRAWSINSDPTIVPLRELEKWEFMGQNVKLSPNDIGQLRLLYQCSTGSRNENTLTIDNLCSTECKCWEYAMGNCDTSDECMGDLFCGPTPTEIPMGRQYVDQLPPYEGTGGLSCSTHCYSTCCNSVSSILLCPETCDAVPPYVAPSEIPERMCLPAGLIDRPSYSPSVSVMPTEPPSESIGPTMTQSPTESPTDTPTSEVNSKWYIDWSIGKCVQNCVGAPPCGGIGQWVTFHDTMELCCDGHLGWMRTYKGCSTMPDETEEPTREPSKASTSSPTTAAPSSVLTKAPSDQPTTSPSKIPSISPTTASPSSSPTDMPTYQPTTPPSKSTSISPTTASPSSSPTDLPTDQPTAPPSKAPSVSPTTASPSSSPTDMPTYQPTTPPSKAPSVSPTTASPSSSPTDMPTYQPTAPPSKPPSVSPTTESPSSSPTGLPTYQPTAPPSKPPSVSPTTEGPSSSPTDMPTYQPTAPPSKPPSISPTTESPSSSPTDMPTDQPTTPPSKSPSVSPTTESPSSSPTDMPTHQPTTPPSKSPSISPTTADPTTSPSKPPSGMPTTATPTPSPLEGPVIWYVDWDRGGKCVRDCEGGQPCGGQKETWERTFGTVALCCGSMPWKPFKDCSFEPSITTTTIATSTATTIGSTGGTTTTTTTAATSTATTTGSTGATTTTTTATTATTTTPRETKWYPGNRACLNDGKVPTWQANRYSSRSTCCTNHFNWDFIKCMDIKPEPSYKWYVQWGLVKCVQDCEESEGGSCGGLIEGSWIRLHSTTETCCATHMSYVLLSECKYLGPGSSR